MVDLSVFKIFNPVDFDEVKNTGGTGISFETSLDPDIKDKDADSLAKIIQDKTKNLNDEEKLAQIERSLAYIRAKGGSELSLDVYEKIKDEDSNQFIDVFGRNDDMPADIQKNSKAKTEWDKIMSGAAYDYITENEKSIKDGLKTADKETKDGKTIYDINDNKALSKLKNQLIENGMDAEDADEDISKMLREKGLIKEDDSVKVSLDSTEALSETEKEKELKNLRIELKNGIEKIGPNKPEEVKAFLEESINKLEEYRPKSEVDEPEKFYTEEIQKILNDTEYKGYHVAATPSLEKNKDGNVKVSIDGKVSESVFVNSDGKFVGENDKVLEESRDKKQVKVNGQWIDKEDIKPSEPKINVYMDTKKEKVEDKAIEEERQYLKDSKNIHKARGDEKSVKELEEAEGILDDAKDGLKKKRESGEKNGKDNTLAVIMAVISAVGTIVAALSQGSGKTVTVTDPGPGYGGGGANNGYGYGSYYANDKYGYNRGYDATVNAAYQRSNQYLSTIYDNPVRTRASIMRRNGMAAIQGQNGYTSPIYS